jgi:N-glycosylase/DNA lyase
MVCEKIRTSQLEIDGVCAVKLDGVELFDVEKTFDCGQCFRFESVLGTAHEKEFAGCAHGRYISVAQDGDTVYIYNSTLKEYESIWKSYLGFDRDYQDINQSILSLSQNPALKSAVNISSGIRILHQDGWEAVCSFIISQNNNIPRIKKLVEALCRRCGDKIDVSMMQAHVADVHKTPDMTVYSFPSPERILPLGIEGLAQLRVGFRAKYIFDAASKAMHGEIDFEFLENSDSTRECIEHLCAVKGIGIKVASCALLFGFARLDAFPIDVWIKKVMAKYFDADFDPASLGEYAGIAQQYLFYYERYIVAKEDEK